MEKNEAKVSLSTFLLIFAIVIIVIMGYYIYKIGQDRNAQAQKVAELEKTVSTISSKAEEIQSVISSATSTASNTGKKYEFDTITLTVPQEMENYGKYTIKEYKNSDFIEDISFYAQCGGIGRLFSFCVQDKSLEPPEDFYRTVKVNDKYRVLANEPTDVQWDDSEDSKTREKSKEIYEFLQKFENQIIDSIELKSESEINNQIKEAFINYMKESMDVNTLADYKVDSVKVISGNEKKQLIESGLSYQYSDILAVVRYSVKPKNINDTSWEAGNGEKQGEWIINKALCIKFKDGKILGAGTGW